LNLSVITHGHLHLYLQFGPASPFIARAITHRDLTTSLTRLVYVAIASQDRYTTLRIDVHEPIDLGELARLALPPVREPAVEGDTKDRRWHKVDLPPTTDKFLDGQTRFIIKKGVALLPPSSQLEDD
jgi:hypothetical protein